MIHKYNAMGCTRLVTPVHLQWGYTLYLLLHLQYHEYILFKKQWRQWYFGMLLSTLIMITLAACSSWMQQYFAGSFDNTQKDHLLNTAAPNCHDSSKSCYSYIKMGIRMSQSPAIMGSAFWAPCLITTSAINSLGFLGPSGSLTRTNWPARYTLVKGECVTCNAQIHVRLQKLFYYFYLEMLLHFSYRFSEENGFGCQRISQKWLPKWFVVCLMAQSQYLTQRIIHITHVYFFKSLLSRSPYGNKYLS